MLSQLHGMIEFILITQLLSLHTFNAKDALKSYLLYNILNLWTNSFSFNLIMSFIGDSTCTVLTFQITFITRYESDISLF